MAKVTGPLHSLRAQGKYGSTITYRRHFGGTVAVQYSQPSGDKSATQHSQRELMRDARAAWRALDEAEKAIWNEQAYHRIGISGYNLFIQDYFRTHEPGAAPVFDGFKFNEMAFA